jgi:hypothetical protein
MKNRFRTFIVLAVAIAIGLGGYSFAQVEHSIHQQGIELAQERLNACKFKLYDLAVGYESKSAHLQKGSPEYNPRQAAVLAGALRVVLTIPSAKECIPVIRESLSKQKNPQGLTPKVERELVGLAVQATNSTLTQPPANNTTHPPGSSTPKHHGRTTPTHPAHPTTPPPVVPPVTVTTPAPAHPSTPAPKVTPTTPKSTPPVKTPPVTTPTTTSPITTPPIEVPPITVPKVEVPPITLPPVEVPPIKINLEEPLCKVPVVKLLTCPKP